MLSEPSFISGASPRPPAPSALLYYPRYPPPSGHRAGRGAGLPPYRTLLLALLAPDLHFVSLIWEPPISPPPPPLLSPAPPRRPARTMAPPPKVFRQGTRFKQKRLFKPEPFNSSSLQQRQAERMGEHEGGGGGAPTRPHTPAHGSCFNQTPKTARCLSRHRRCHQAAPAPQACRAPRRPPPGAAPACCERAGRGAALLARAQQTAPCPCPCRRDPGASRPHNPPPLLHHPPAPAPARQHVRRQRALWLGQPVNNILRPCRQRARAYQRRHRHLARRRLGAQQQVDASCVAAPPRRRPAVGRHQRAAACLDCVAAAAQGVGAGRVGDVWGCGDEGLHLHQAGSSPASPQPWRRAAGRL